MTPERFPVAAYDIQAAHDGDAFSAAAGLRWMVDIIRATFDLTASGSSMESLLQSFSSKFSIEYDGPRHWSDGTAVTLAVLDRRTSPHVMVDMYVGQGTAAHRVYIDISCSDPRSSRARSLVARLAPIFVEQVIEMSSWRLTEAWYDPL